ncbi:class I SAM-dependent methyltransferase [Janthinobacterium aquaticum]|uniref:class I SAM-dependent methyltransferase n=1 Tax=Janthinobacterium sp. FT58W TaxID=2654254 RepID=UPI00126418D7|nr:class I SAM-dependent methyltransferase [Janthinobacterium sp. FT58W]KAB8044476.1 hypothetical protein GCM43_04545 [Janthinobacterium sp. FT58W]
MQKIDSLAKGKILVFPGGMPKSLEFLQQCQADGKPVLGASSLAHDPTRQQYAAWAYLPYVTDASFDAALQALIDDQSVTGIYTPNPVIWDHLHRTLQTLAPGVALLNASPADAELTLYRRAQSQVATWLEQPLAIGAAKPARSSASSLQLAALFRHAELIPGMCDREKMFALCEIARHAVDGDIVEIGSWWGKSAFLLAWLARCHQIGKLLCVDPWSNAHLVQNDATGLVDQVSAQFDASEALTVFEMNLLPYSHDHVNYLRLPSESGARHYRQQREVHTDAFGTTCYQGSIAILHIDGNHTYAAASADLACWSGLVHAGGWIIVDDYIWPYGNGPQRAGDEFIGRYRDRIATAFVMGSALFMQLSHRLDEVHVVQG